MFSQNRHLTINLLLIYFGGDYSNSTMHYRALFGNVYSVRLLRPKMFWKFTQFFVFVFVFCFCFLFFLFRLFVCFFFFKNHQIWHLASAWSPQTYTNLRKGLYGASCDTLFYVVRKKKNRIGYRLPKKIRNLHLPKVQDDPLTSLCRWDDILPWSFIVLIVFTLVSIT